MQNINVELSIPVPDDFVLIKKVELEELKGKDLSGVWWTMKDLERRLNKSHEWIKDNILFPTRFKNILDVKNGGFVYYPEKRGETWSFLAVKMSEFLEDNFVEIYQTRENR